MQITLMIQTKLFSNLYLVKFLDILAKPFSPCDYWLYLLL